MTVFYTRTVVKHKMTFFQTKAVLQHKTNTELNLVLYLDKAAEILKTVNGIYQEGDNRGD